MTLDKAIKILTAWKTRNYDPPLADEINALNLAVQALDRITYLRRKFKTISSVHLLGETDVDII